MAEAYKGLTIKFGGDLTNLEKALTNIRKTSNLAGSELRRVNQAMRLDPSGVQSAALKFDLLETKSEQARAKVRLLELAMKDMSKRRADLTSMSIGQLVEEATKGRTEYNKLNEQIRITKNELEALTGQKFPTEDVDKWLMGLDQTKPKIKELVNEYYRLHAARQNFDTDLRFKDAERMANLRTEIAKTSAEQEKLNREMKQMVAESAGVDRIGQKFLEIKNSTQQATHSADALEKEMQQLDNALRLDPTNVEAAARRLETLSQQATNSEKKVQLLTNQMRQIEDAIGRDKASAVLKDIGTSAESASKNFDEATNSVQKLEAKIISLKDEQRDLKVTQGEYSEPYRKLGYEIEKAEVELKDLLTTQSRAKSEFQEAQLANEYRKLNTELTETKAKLNSVNNELSESSGRFSMSTSSLTTLGLALYSTVTPYVGMASSKIIESADTIDSAFRNMTKTVEGTEEQFQELKAAAIEYSNTHVTSADQILQIEAMGGQLGIATDQLRAFSEVVSNLDIATNMETETIAENLGSLSGILHMSEQDFSKFGDSLVRLGNNMPTQESNIMDITKRIGSLGSIVGFTAPQILAWASAIAATGQNSEAAGTAISNTFSNIETAVASGGDALEGFANVAGKSAEEFAAMWRANPSQALKEFIEGLKNIKDSGGSVDKTLQDLGINATRQKQALLGLTQTVGTLDDALSMSQNAWDGVSDQWGKAGDAAREADKKAQGFSGAMQKLRNIAENFAAVAGESLTVPVQELGNAILTLAKFFEGLSPEMQTFLTLLAGISAGLGPAITLFAGFSTAAGSIKKSMTKAAVGYEAATRSAAGFVDAIQRGIEPMNEYSRKTRDSAKDLRRHMYVSKAAAAAMRLVEVAAVAAAAVLVSKLATAIGEYVEHQKNMKKATEGLTDSLYSMGEGFQAGSSEAQNAIQRLTNKSKSYEVVRQEVRDTVQAQAELADSIRETMTEVGNKIGVAEEYGDELLELAGRSDLTGQEVGKMKTSVDMVNEALGLNLQVVKDGDGAYKVYRDGVELTKDKLEELIETTELAMQVEAQKQALTESYNQQTEAAKALTDAQNKLNEAEKKRNELASGEAAAWEVANAEVDEAIKLRDEAKASYDGVAGAVDNLRKNMDFLNEAQTKGAESIEYAIASNNLFVTSMNEAKKSVPDFANAIRDLGIDVSEFNSLNEEQLIGLVSSYDGSAESIVSALDEIGLGWMVNGDAAAVAVARLKEDLISLGFTEDELANKNAETLQKIKDSYANLAQATGTDISTLRQKLKDFGVSQEQVAALTPEQVALITASYSNGSATLDTILHHIHDNTVDQLGSAGTDGGQAYADGMGSKKGETRSSGQAIAQSGKDGAESVSPYSSGQNFTQGFINGMGSLVRSVFSKGFSIASQAVAGLKAGQQEGSPSKLTAESGRFFVLGYVNRIKSDTKLAVSAAKNMGKEAALALQKETDNVDTTFALSTEHGYGAARAGNVYNEARETFNVYIDGAIVNDNEQIGEVLKDTLIEYKRKSSM